MTDDASFLVRVKGLEKNAHSIFIHCLEKWLKVVAGNERGAFRGIAFNVELFNPDQFSEILNQLIEDRGRTLRTEIESWTVAKIEETIGNERI